MPPPADREQALRDIYLAAGETTAAAYAYHLLMWCRIEMSPDAKARHELVALLAALVECLTTIRGAAPIHEDLLAGAVADILREAVKDYAVGQPVSAVRAAAARLLQKPTIN